MGRTAITTLLCVLACVVGCIEPSDHDDMPIPRQTPPASEPKPRAAPAPEPTPADGPFPLILDGDVTKAEDALKAQLRQPDLSHRARARALFWLGYCQELRGRTRDAAAVYGRVERDFPRSAYGDLAQERRALLRGGP